MWCHRIGMWEKRDMGDPWNNEDHFIEFYQADKNTLIYGWPAWGQHSLDTLDNLTPGNWAINHYPIAKMMAARFFPLGICRLNLTVLVKYMICLRRTLKPQLHLNLIQFLYFIFFPLYVRCESDRSDVNGCDEEVVATRQTGLTVSNILLAHRRGNDSYLGPPEQRRCLGNLLFFFFHKW